MRHISTQTLTTARLLLRRLTPDDAQAMYDNWASDPLVTQYLRWTPHPSAAHTRQLLAAWAELYPNPDYYQWAMVEKATGAVFGSFSLFDDRLGEPGAADGWQTPGLSCAEGVWMPGYCIGRTWWGKGYTTEALRAVTDLWFGAVGGDWLACCHNTANPASGRVMQHVGFVHDHDGIDHKFDGTPVLCRYYALTRAAWAKQQESE